MKYKEKSQLQNASVEDLLESVKGAEKQLAQLKLDRFTKQIKNLREMRTLRRKIAVMKTILTAKVYKAA